MRKELLFKNWRYRFQVRFDDEDKWYEGSSVIVGKSRYYAGRYNLFNGASLSSPLLHAAIFTGYKRGDFIRYAACIAMEALTLDNDIIIKTAKKIEIRCNEENFAAELDGDAVTTAPYKLKWKKCQSNFWHRRGVKKGETNREKNDDSAFGDCSSSCRRMFCVRYFLWC